MSREWKPGDVADLTYTFAEGGRAIRVTGCKDESHSGDDHWHFWNGSNGDGSAAGSIRPLVVIDPEDREAVERLLSGYAGWRGSDEVKECPHYVADMQAAFREFANPTPPKPDEPLGLGAVVEDADGEDWHRSRDGRWLHMGEVRPESRVWHGVAAIRVLSEGVTS